MSQADSTRVVLLRHAQSEWNRQNRFTGWANPGLTELGVAEAERAADTLSARGIGFDTVYSSRLRRARETADIVLDRLGRDDLAVATDWRLNERHYGALQGEDRAAMLARVGERQVWRWRRGYLDRPPQLADDDRRHPAHDPAWADIPRARLPNGERLVDARERVLDFWLDRVVPDLQAGRQVLVASHGNTLRALIMALHGMSVDEVERFEIPTGVPIVYAFSRRGLPIGWHYLDDDRDAA